MLSVSPKRFWKSAVVLGLMGAMGGLFWGLSITLQNKAYHISLPSQGTPP